MSYSNKNQYRQGYNSWSFGGNCVSTTIASGNTQKIQNVSTASSPAPNQGQGQQQQQMQQQMQSRQQQQQQQMMPSRPQQMQQQPMQMSRSQLHQPTNGVNSLAPVTLKVPWEGSQGKYTEVNGVKYIPLKWEDILGGQENMSLSMAPSAQEGQPGQVRVAFNAQQQGLQKGEVPLKLVSWKTVDDYSGKNGKGEFIGVTQNMGKIGGQSQPIQPVNMNMIPGQGQNQGQGQTKSPNRAIQYPQGQNPGQIPAAQNQMSSQQMALARNSSSNGHPLSPMNSRRLVSGPGQIQGQIPGQSRLSINNNNSNMSMTMSRYSPKNQMSQMTMIPTGQRSQMSRSGMQMPGQGQIQGQNHLLNRSSGPMQMSGSRISVAPAPAGNSGHSGGQGQGKVIGQMMITIPGDGPDPGNGQNPPCIVLSKAEAQKYLQNQGQGGGQGQMVKFTGGDGQNGQMHQPFQLRGQNITGQGQGQVNQTQSEGQYFPGQQQQQQRPLGAAPSQFPAGQRRLAPTSYRR